MRVEGFVYFIRAVGIGRIKIGLSEDSWGRLKSLMTACPVPIEPLGVIAGDIRVELSLHAKFSAFRRNGEWFEEAPELLEYIRDYATPFIDEREMDRLMEEIVSHSGRVRTIREWANSPGLTPRLVRKRIQLGITGYYAVTLPYRPEQGY